MQDQVSRLCALGVRAELLAADLTDRTEATRIQNEAVDPARSGLRFLYVTCPGGDNKEGRRAGGEGRRAGGDPPCDRLLH